MYNISDSNPVPSSNHLSDHVSGPFSLAIAARATGPVPIDSSRPDGSADMHSVGGLAILQIFVSGPRLTGPTRHQRPQRLPPRYSPPQTTYLAVFPASPEPSCARNPTSFTPAQFRPFRPPFRRSNGPNRKSKTFLIPDAPRPFQRAIVLLPIPSQSLYQLA